ncbi:TetR/AcrR family transcriptional regulator [Bordetella genomosp. 13]|uniref:TetR/AcrR family transcriptional regulator n=1 Tax=Bordetella genomosp. 13 TaxID=463040 RepID=UPI0021B5C6A6|nr:TetR/AcrR family transcriptional regulator [Bordetella genomosp. 13]
MSEKTFPEDPAAERPARGRPRLDPSNQKTKAAILKAAVKVFSRHGYDAGSIEKVSKEAKTVDRMIYYYFGNKQGLYNAALEEMYSRMGQAEAAVDVDLDDPRKAVVKTIRFVFDYYASHPELIVLLNDENMHKGRHLARNRPAQPGGAVSPILSRIQTIVAEGQRTGLFRRGVKARHVYLMILASGYFFISNRYTLSRFLGEPLDAKAHEEWTGFVSDSVLRILEKARA